MAVLACLRLLQKCSRQTLEEKVLNMRDLGPNDQKAQSPMGPH